MTAALNMIDMLEEPKDLPRAQSELLEKNELQFKAAPTSGIPKSPRTCARKSRAQFTIQPQRWSGFIRRRDLRLRRA